MTMMFAHVHNHACMLACVHTIFEHALAHISAQLGQIREIEVSMEKGGGCSGINFYTSGLGTFCFSKGQLLINLVLLE